ncbi:MAG: hypothetical protein ACRD8U_13995, partial [Pyrinomonadaceae bacterium]
MVPPNFFRPIILVCCLFLIVISAATLVPTEHAQANQGYTKAFCYSTQDHSTVYFSTIFDVNVKPHMTASTQPVNNAFFNYLKEEFDYPNRFNYPTGCAIFHTLSQAQARKQQLAGEAQQANKQIVEVNWKPAPSVEVLQGQAGFMPTPAPQPTFTVCALGHERTMYFSAVFDTVGTLVNPAWNDAFNDFLRKNYSAEGEASCTTLNTRREAQRHLEERVAGVRVRNKAVETGWRYNASVVITKPAPKPTPKVDDDPEPPSRPAATPAPLQARDFATKEMPSGLAYCQNNRMMSGAFNCQCLSRQIYNYRIEHPADTLNA